MGKTTGIAYARSTRNIWAGCTKVGPGCDGCFAEAFNRWTQGKDPETGEAKNWGPGRPRIPYLDGAWRDLRAWNMAALVESSQPVNAWRAHLPPGFWPVFINTMSDFFDNEVPQAWRDEAFPVFEECSNLTILLVTKRIGNAAGMVPERWIRDGFPPNVRVIATMVNRAELERDIRKLLALPCKNGVSFEPALEEVDWRRVDLGGRIYLDALTGLHTGESGPGTIDTILADLPTLPGAYPRGIEWLLPGGESHQAGHKARPFDIAVARSTIAQGKAAGVPVFFKQTGDNVRVPRADAIQFAMLGSWTADSPGASYGTAKPFHKGGENPIEWPADLRVQEWAL